VGCLSCLEGERKRCRFVDVTGRFPMSLDLIREHKDTNATKGGAPMGVVFVLPSRRKKEVSFRKCYWEVSNVFGLGS
jgi:hypothetical protein